MAALQLNEHEIANHGFSYFMHPVSTNNTNKINKITSHMKYKLIDRYMGGLVVVFFMQNILMFIWLCSAFATLYRFTIITITCIRNQHFL